MSHLGVAYVGTISLRRPSAILKSRHVSAETKPKEKCFRLLAAHVVIYFVLAMAALVSTMKRP
jgi:hypothetical protein